jgi:tetratricopeptide (TPR) repeat protein
MLAGTVSAQFAGDQLNGQGSLRDRVGNARSYSTAPNTGILIFNVFSERNGHRLDRQALLKLVNRASQSPIWQTTENDAQGPYDESAALGVFINVAYGIYDVEISAVGYLGTHQEVVVGSSMAQQHIEIALHRDPNAMNLDIVDGAIAARARKDTRAGIFALKSGKLDVAETRLGAAYKTAPSSPELNFLLGYLYFQKRDFDKAGSYLGTAASLKPQDARTLTLLGRADLEKKDYPAARSALEQAILADAENWLPHDLLADAYLHQKDYGKARDEAEVAITKGKSAASASQLTLGQAFLNLGQEQQGIEALQVFLQESPRHPVAGQVRELISQIQDHAANPSPADGSGAKTVLTGVDPLAALAGPKLAVESWRPPGVDDVKLALAPGGVCPSEKVIEESGKRVQELVDDVSRFAAVEDLLHQSLDTFGVPTRTETRKYNYVASISAPPMGGLSVDEFRADKMNLEGYPDRIASSGFAALALVFHPLMRDSFEMTCEGLGDWHGQPSWLVHFRQRDDRPNRMHSYKVGNQVHAVKLKGRAWVTADKFQIVRIESDMVSAMPEIRLLSEHQVVEYGPIRFEQKNTSLWLPKSAEIYFDFRGHRYYRRHSFDRYMLFSVEENEKRKEPVVPPDAVEKKS